MEQRVASRPGGGRGDEAGGWRLQVHSPHEKGEQEADQAGVGSWCGPHNCPERYPSRDSSLPRCGLRWGDHAGLAGEGEEAYGGH